MSAAKSKALELFRAQRLPEARAAFETVCADDPADAEAWVALGVIHGMQGDLDQAERCCRQAVERAPGSSEAHANLGVVLAARRDYPRAVESYRRALALKPEHPPTHNNLGAALNALGQPAEAKASYERAIQLSPGYAEAHYNLANLLLVQHQPAAARDRYQTVLALNPNHVAAHTNLGKALSELGQNQDALQSYETALRLAPRQASAHNNLGVVLITLKEFERARFHFKEALRLQPAYAEAYNNLGLAYTKEQKLAEATASYHEAIRLDPRRPEFHNNLAIALAGQERLDEAVASYRSALALKPEYAEAHNNIGIALQALGRDDDAIGHYRESLRLDPEHAETHTNLGVALYDHGKLEEAAQHHREALRLDPAQIPARLNLGVVLQAQGRLDESLALFRELTELQPDYAPAHSNLLFALNYQPGQTPDALYREHRRWAERHARAAPATIVHTNRREPERKLRVGYVSPDLRGHSVAYFTAPVLANHDRDRIETFCYAQVPRGDAMTERLKSLAGHWRRTVGMSDAELAAQVREDGIDILVDLAGHTANSRLTAFTSRPAPVQIGYLGYPNTTCSPAIAYRLTDAWADPPGQERFHSEELIRLPRGFLCYAPPPDAPEVSALPSLTGGPVTFGSFNNLAKINTEVVALWARLMQALPDARLLIKNGSLRDAATRERYHELFARLGVARERVTLAAWTPAVRDHLAIYAGIDIALDTFPYNGTTTTCEALWMGVPVIALAGDRHAARVGVSLLTRIGLQELIAEDPEDYISIAQRLSQDPHRLSELRHSLRARIQASTLGDAATFTRELEDAYRGLWRRWCEKS